MSDITDKLLQEINDLDIGRNYKEPICMLPVSKNLRGEFIIRDRDLQRCKSPDCETLKALHDLKFEVTSHRPCDSLVSRRLGGTLAGELVFAYIENGNRRGYHIGKFKWGGGASTLLGQLSGVTNAGTHRDPLMNCETCDARGHMEGRLDAVVVDGDNKGCRILATYVFAFDPSQGAGSTAAEGTLEGVLICDCTG